MGTSTRTRLDMEDGSTSIWMMRCGFLGEMLGIADDPVIEARAYRQQHVAVLHGHVGLDRAMHAQHAEEQGVWRRIAAQTHQGAGDWIAQHARQFGNLLAALPRTTPPPV
jgi:hypothetical protein